MMQLFEWSIVGSSAGGSLDDEASGGWIELEERRDRTLTFFARPKNSSAELKKSSEKFTEKID